jgi:thiol-disulfide isomerase/thioredoxin
MIIELNEKNFNEYIAKHEKVLVFFYREKGCSFCDKMKPIVDEYALKTSDVVVGKYSLGSAPDSITEGLVERFPTFVAYVDGLPVGKQEGSMTMQKMADTFNVQQSKNEQVIPVAVENASYAQLLADKHVIIDQITSLRIHLNKLDAEISKREHLVYGLKE